VGRPPCESLEVLDEVCLVEVAEVNRQPCPVDRAAAPYLLDGFVQPVALNDPFRAHANVTTEESLERPLRHVNDRSKVFDFGDARIGCDLIDYLANHNDVLITGWTSSSEQFLRKFDILFVIRVSGNGFAEDLSGFAEDVRQRGHTVCKLGHGPAEKWVEAARPELDAEDPSHALEHPNEPAFDDAYNLKSTTLYSDVDRGMR